MGQRFFITGVVLLLLGLQLRYVDSFVLTPKATQFIEEKMQSTGFQSTSPYQSMLLTSGPTMKKTIQPPRWIGYALLSVGAVLMLHGLTMRSA